MKMHLVTSSGYLNAIRSSCIVFIITIIIVIINVTIINTNSSYDGTNTTTKMNTTKSSNTNTRNTNNSSSDSTLSAKYFKSSTKKKTMLRNKIVVISAASSSFNGNSSQQQQNFNLDSITAAASATVGATTNDDGVKKNVATNFTYTTDAITSGGNAMTDVAAAASLNNNENVGIAVADDNNNYSNIVNDDDNNVVHNSFYDKINKSNQQNEFNERLETTTAIPIFSPLPPPPSSSSSATSSLPSTTVKHEDTLSTSFENAELQESMMLYTQQQDQEQHQQHKQYQKLLLHRQKRYLVFPEGSSFQLVFDLIIPIVDYTNFAIMGITCAVAWELPSKPPSEIIENIRDKLNEGAFGLSRRNDSKTNIQYIDSNVKNGGGSVYNDGEINGGTIPTRDYTNNVKIPATIVSENSAVINDGNDKRKALLASAGAPAIPNYDFYQNEPIITTATNTQFKPYTQTQEQQQQQQYAFHAPPSAPFSYYSPSVPLTSAYQTYPHHNPQNYFNGNNSNNKNMNEYPTSNSYSKYYKNTNGVSGTSGYAMNAKDKLKFTDWHQQHWRNEYESKHEYQGKNKYNQQEQKLQQQQTQQAQQNMKYTGWDKNNWWQHNKHRIQDNWREKQHEWFKYENEIPAPPPPLQKPLGSTTANTRTGRYRKILQMPPKHRVYPVFGKRRRRRSEHRDTDAFELKLELIHLREQLQTRQKLYAKIEKLYKVRGHNGTACVLRALCETGQREHQTEPQTFITELLRAIFVLPKGLDASHSHFRSNRPPPSKRHNNRYINVQQKQPKSKLKPKLKLKLKPGEIKLEQLNAYIERHYWEAAAQQHAHNDDTGSRGGNCAQRFAMCEHSIWSDFDI